MSKLPSISGKALVKLLTRRGFVLVSQRGSHIKLRQGNIVVVVPNHKIIKKGTLYNIIKLTKIDLDK